ncbi:unnamed protein product [Lampetra fluviatilis]
MRPLLWGRAVNVEAGVPVAAEGRASLDPRPSRLPNPRRASVGQHVSARSIRGREAIVARAVDATIATSPTPSPLCQETRDLLVLP